MKNEPKRRRQDTDFRDFRQKRKLVQFHKLINSSKYVNLRLKGVYGEVSLLTLLHSRRLKDFFYVKSKLENRIGLDL